MTRAELLAEAASWIGTPWVHQGSAKGVGADCIGLVGGVAANAGSEEGARFLATPAWRNYGRHPDPGFLFGVCDQLMDRVPTASALPGDVHLFNCGRHPMHFAILAPAEHMIHAWLVARRTCEHQLNDAWRARIVRTYRLRGIV